MYSLRVLTFFLLVTFSLGSIPPYYDPAEADQHFADFIRKYEKNYESQEEYRMRFEIFKRNLEKINEWNANYKSENGGFFISQFADQDSHHSCFLDLSLMSNTTMKVAVEEKHILNAPAELDYRKQNLVTPVKDQGQCRTCYIFAAIASIESMHAKQTKGELLSLSEQQDLDCYSNGGCFAGGWPHKVMDELVNPGCMAEDDYPYQSEKGTCKADPSKVKVKVKGSQMFDISGVESLKGALYQNGAPIAIAFEAPASLSYWHGSDVYSPGLLECRNKANHAVLLVGYGKDAASGKSYWLIKNSWGPSNGDKGFVKIDMKNNCDFGNYACTAKVA